MIKTLPWAHKSEFRFIRFPDAPCEKIGLQVAGQFGTFRSEVLTGVTIGHAMPDNRVEEILTIVAARSAPVPVYRRGATVGEQAVRLA